MDIVIYTIILINWLTNKNMSW